MTPRERAVRVYETYRQSIMLPPHKKNKPKTLVQLIADEIKDALNEDRKGRKRK